MIANPYKPSDVTDSVLTIRDWERNQCPHCLHRQSIWKGINTIRTYRCECCNEPLVVTLSRTATRILMTLGAVLVATIFASRYLFEVDVPSHLFGLPFGLIAIGFLTRYWFGYFHPAGHRWIRTRRELNSQPQSE
ncbi:hypothetical protein [Planctomycetes bacterium CA13]|uniref:hypothetical protein n=1 Tax=Novipirellula herctigrandis TaxID=2527986 RepID=UPI0011B7CAF6